MTHHKPSKSSVSPKHLGPDSSKSKCHSCGASVKTSTKPVPGLLTWGLCICLCCFGCIFGCCLIPFCVEDCQDIEHRCPRCDAYIGKYKRCS